MNGEQKIAYRRRPWLPDLDPSVGLREPWPLTAPVALFFACVLVLSWPWLLGFATIPWDAKAHFQPQIQFLAGSIARGEWPWWNPYVFGGQPQIADPQSMIFSLPFLLLALLDGSPSLWAVDMTVIGCMAAGGVGLMLWFRDQGWHWGGAIIAALAFAFGAAMAWRIQHTGQVLSLAYMPWAMLFLERTIARASFAYAVATGVIGAMILLGRDQVALLVVYLLAARALWLIVESWHAMPSRLRVAAALSAGGATAIVLVAVPILMTVLLAADSNRPTIDFEGAGRGSLHPILLLTLVLPQIFGAAGHMVDYWGPPSFAWGGTGLFTAQNVGQLYIGAIPVLLVLAAGLMGRLWAREVRFFTIAAAIMLLYGLGWYTPVFRVLYTILPGVNLYRRPADAVFLIGAVGAILAGYAAHRLLEAPWVLPRRPALIVIAAVIAGSFALAVACGIYIERVERLAPPLLGGLIAFLAAALAIAWAVRNVAIAPGKAVVALAAVLTADLYLNNVPTTSSVWPVAEYDVLQPETKDPTILALKRLVVDNDVRRDRIELAGLGFHWPNASMTHRLENTLGYNPVRLGDYSRAVGAEDTVGLPEQRKFSALMPSYKSPMADLLGLRFIATGAPVETMDKRLPPGALKLVFETATTYVYENPAALPRVMFATEARRTDFHHLLETGAWPDFDPRQTVLIEAPTRTADAPRGAGTARIVDWGNNRVVLDAESPAGGWAVLNDIWHPWWFAEVDGRPAPILKANVLFRAVELPAGKHRVVLTFRPLHGLWNDLRRRH